MTTTYESGAVMMRSKLARAISTEVRSKYRQDKTCDELWNLLVHKEKTHAGSGSYGDVWVVRLRKFPSFPIVIKRTKRLDLNEVKQSLMAGALAEVGANPHFNILLGHFHCETQSSITPPGRSISWKDGEHQLQQLTMKKQQSGVSAPEVEQINTQIRHIQQQMYPEFDDIEKLRLLKNAKEKQLRDKYRTVLPYERNDPQVSSDLMLIDSLSQTYEYMQEIRAQQYATHELIMMELSNGKFSSLIDQNAQPHLMISAICQVCLGFLSFTSFFGLVQNDIHMGNVMYNTVDPTLAYVYKIGKSHIRVPLFGMLMKIIDFGLSTNVRNFNKAPRPGKPPTHWCPGGRGKGPDDQLECSVYMRDVLEFFFHLAVELRNGALKNWAAFAHKKAQAIVNGSIKILTEFIIVIFHADTLSRFGLPGVITMSQFPIPVDVRYQTEAFEITNRKKYMSAIHQVIENKVWRA
jgi:hypothetical protein